MLEHDFITELMNLGRNPILKMTRGYITNHLLGMSRYLGRMPASLHPILSLPFFGLVAMLVQHTGLALVAHAISVIM